MRVLTTKKGDLLSCFDKVNELEASIKKPSSKHLPQDFPLNNHDIAVHKREIKGQLPLEQFFGF